MLFTNLISIKKFEPKLVSNHWINPPLKSNLLRSQESFEKILKTSNSIQDVAHVFEIPVGQLIYLLKNKEEFYNSFDIPKKSGSTRRIDAPKRGMAILQTKLKSFIEAHYRPRSNVYGFIKGSDKGIKENAANHRNKNYVINLDLEDFFGSITFRRVRGVFINAPFHLDPKVATILANICTLNDSLPQGACTSPVLSNLCSVQLDKKMNKIAKDFRLRYSRYADDITFSGQKLPKKLITIIRTTDENGAHSEAYKLNDFLILEIKNTGYSVNLDKFRVKRGSEKQEVTGLVVNKKVNVPKKFIRETRALIHDWGKSGLLQAEKTYLSKKDITLETPNGTYFKNVIFGRLSFIRQIKGRDDSTYLSLIKKLVSFELKTPKFVNLDKGLIRMFDVFICHASEDKSDIAHPLNEALKGENLQVFIDDEQIFLGDSLIDEINSALRRSRFVVAIISAKSIKKGWPMQELKSVLSQQISTGSKRLIPVIKKEDLAVVMEELPLLHDTLYFKFDNNAKTAAEQIRQAIEKQIQREG